MLQVRPLVQAYPLTSSTVDHLVRQLSGFITRMENELAVRSVIPAGASSTTQTSTPAFERLLDAGMLGLEFLPESAAPIVVVVTDGVFQMGGLSVAEYDDAIMRFCRHDICLSVIHLSPRHDPSTALGYIQDSDFLRLALGSTGGCLIHLDEIMEPLLVVGDWLVVHDVMYICGWLTYGVMSVDAIPCM